MGRRRERSVHRAQISREPSQPTNETARVRFVAFIAKQSSHFYAAPRGKKPNHLLMHAWSLFVFARKLSLQALRQSAGPNGDSRQDRTFHHSMNSGSPI